MKALLILLASLGIARADFALRDGDTLAFLGDSITAARGYTKIVEHYTLMRYPDRKIRLYDRRRGCWVGEYVHESVKVDGPVAQLKGNLLHYTCENMEQHRRTVDHYTSLAAQDARSKGGQSSLLEVALLPPWKFLETYVFRAGFLDGAAGLTIARMAAYYVYLKHAKLRRLPPE